MRKQTVNTLLSAMALSGQAFLRPEYDALRVPDPVSRDSNICGVRDSFLFDQDNGAGGGGGGKKIPEELQGTVNEIVKGRLAEEAAKFDKERQGFAAKLKEFEPLAAQIADLQKRIGEADAEKQAALEAKSNEGKSELQILQANFDKAQKTAKDIQAALDAKTNEFTKLLETERNGRVDDAKRNWATQVLAAGAADGMSEYAINALLAEGQFELDDNRRVKKVTFEGGVHEKPADVSAAFFKARPGFAKPPAGGSGDRRGNSGNANQLEQHSSIEGLLGTGLDARRTAS